MPFATGPITQLCWVTDDLERHGPGLHHVELARIGPQMREFYAEVKVRSREGSR